MTAPLIVPIDDEIDAVLAEISDRIGMHKGEIVAKLMGAHMADLCEYASYLEQLPERPARAQELAPWMLHNYGPTSLVDDINRLDPDYKTNGERFMEGLAR